MNKERALQIIEDQLYSSNHMDVQRHYGKLKYNIYNPMPQYTGLKILIFQPVAAGDIIISSLSAELFQIKFPGCIVDYMVSVHEVRDLLIGNPFINDIIVSNNWDLVKKRDTHELGALGREYDIVYSLYWWNPPIYKSFLEDLELPTDYTRVRVYLTDYHRKAADKILKNYSNIRPLIILQSELNEFWDDNSYKYCDLRAKLTNYGTVIETGGIQWNYGVVAAMLQKADLFVGLHGSVEHVAAAVGCQCITLPKMIYNPEHYHVAYYQNKYRDIKKLHKVVKPKDFCGDYRCVTYTPVTAHHTLPPYGFENRFPPHVYKPCDYKDFKESCVHEITPNDILEKVEEATKFNV